MNPIEYKQDKESEWKWSGVPAYEVHIPREYMQEIFAFVDEVTTEISGLGDVEIEDGKLHIRKLRMFKQKCSGAETTITPESLEEITVNAAQTGDDLSKLRFWWHSHAHMGVFWSKTDEECIESLLGCWGWCLSIVFNKKREILARLDGVTSFMGKKITIINHRLKVMVVDKVPDDLKARVEAQVRELVSPTFVSYQNSSGYGAGANHHSSGGAGRYRRWVVREPYLTGEFVPKLGWVNPKTGELWSAKDDKWYLPDGTTKEQVASLLEGLRQKQTETEKKKVCYYCHGRSRLRWSTEANGLLCKKCRKSQNRGRRYERV